MVRQEGASASEAVETGEGVAPAIAGGCEERTTTAAASSAPAAPAEVDPAIRQRDRLATTTAAILVDALRRAEVADPGGVSQAITPLIVAALRENIEDATAAGGRSADRAARFQSIAALTKACGSLAAGSLGSLLPRSFAKTPSPQQIEKRPRLNRLLTLERDNHRIVANWRAEGSAAELTSNVVGAIRAFASREFAAGHGELRMLKLRSSWILLRASARLFIAAEFSAEPELDDKARIDRLLVSLLKNEARLPSDADLARIAAELSAPPAPEKRKFWKWAAAAGAVLLVCGAAAFFLRPEPLEQRLQNDFAAAKSAQPQLAGWPLSLSVDRDGGRVVLGGLAPEDADLDALARALPTSPYRLEVPALRVASAETVAANAARTADLTANAVEQTRALRDRVDDLESRLSRLEKWQADRLAEAETPAARLARLAQTLFIPFRGDEKLLYPQVAYRQIAELATELKATGASLRVVGYADASGAPVKNVALSKMRADAVVELLVAEGVDAKKLVPVGRAAEAPIAAEGSAERRRNRRVTFELLGTTEPGK